MSRPWLGRSSMVREKFLRWHRHHLPGWAMACDLDLVEYRRVEVEPGWCLYSPVALAEVVPFGAPLPGPRLPQLEVLDHLGRASKVPAVVLEVTQDLARVRIRRLPDFRVLAEGGPEVYAAWLAEQHRRNRSVSTASRRYP
jgi:hypothetical protein